MKKDPEETLRELNTLGDLMRTMEVPDVSGEVSDGPKEPFAKLVDVFPGLPNRIAEVISELHQHFSELHQYFPEADPLDL